MAKEKRKLGPLDKPWDRNKPSERVRWAEQGSIELASRLSTRLSITKKDAKDILRIIGQEGANMAVEGWIFSIPYLGIFYTKVTALRASTLKEYLGQILGGNKKLKFEQTPTLRKRFKEEKLREATVKPEAE